MGDVISYIVTKKQELDKRYGRENYFNSLPGRMKKIILDKWEKDYHDSLKKRKAERWLK